MIFRSLLLLTAVGALAGLPAAAQTTSAAASSAGPEGKPHMSLKERFDQMDTNHDGFIERGEATGRIAKNFDVLDTDHDGKLSLDEIRAGMKAERAKGQAPMAAAPAAPAGETGADARFKAMDTDGDGRISFAEFTAREKAIFDKLDTNHDGYIEPSEWPKERRGKGNKGGAPLGDNAFGSGTWGKSQDGGKSQTAGGAASSSAASQ